MGVQLQRKLGLWTSISIVIGSVIGSSIFMKPAMMAQQLPSPILLLAVWFVAGGVSIIGAMINAEIGVLYPDTGGQYIYFKHLYGKFFAFVYGWAAFIVINTAAIAAIAFVFAEFSQYFFNIPQFSAEIVANYKWHLPLLGDLFPLQNAGVKAMAVLLIVIMTAINVRSVKTGGAVQVFLTVLKVAALMVLICSLFGGTGSLSNMIDNPASFDSTTWPVFLGFVAATSGALASYDGWNNLGFIAGEIKAPQRNIPRSLIMGLCICMLLYILTTLAYLYIMPVDEMKASTLVAADAMRKAGGFGTGAFIALLVMVSTAGAVNGNVMPCARINFAMADDSCFFPSAKKVHPTYFTPSIALWMQCTWACVFVITGSFNMLADLFIFISWIFYGFGAYGIFIIRKKGLGREGDFKMKGYPFLPIVFLLFSALYFVITIYTDVINYTTGKAPFINSLFGLLLTVTGIPFYFYFRRRVNKLARGN